MSHRTTKELLERYAKELEKATQHPEVTVSESIVKEEEIDDEEETKPDSGQTTLF